MPSIFQDANFADVQVECNLDLITAEEFRAEMEKKGEEDNASDTDKG